MRKNLLVLGSHETTSTIYDSLSAPQAYAAVFAGFFSHPVSRSGKYPFCPGFFVRRNPLVSLQFFGDAPGNDPVTRRSYA
jgi:hypothetical protein